MMLRLLPRRELRLFQWRRRAASRVTHVPGATPRHVFSAEAQESGEVGAVASRRRYSFRQNPVSPRSSKARSGRQLCNSSRASVPGRMPRCVIMAPSGRTITSLPYCSCRNRRCSRSAPPALATLWLTAPPICVPHSYSFLHIRRETLLVPQAAWDARAHAGLSATAAELPNEFRRRPSLSAADRRPRAQQRRIIQRRSPPAECGREHYALRIVHGNP